MHHVKSRLRDAPFGPNGGNCKANTNQPRLEIDSFIRNWPQEGRPGHKTQLHAMWAIPYFFSPMPHGAAFQDVNVLAIVECLQTMTDVAKLRKLKAHYSSYNKASREAIWLRDAYTRLILNLIELHAESILSRRQGRTTEVIAQSTLISSWSAITATAGLYVHSVLRLHKAIDDRLQGRVLFILQRDLERNLQDFKTKDSTLLGLCLWKAFIGIVSILKCQTGHNVGVVQKLEPRFKHFIHVLNESLGVACWMDARVYLEAITWPERMNGDDEFEEVWNMALY